MAKDAAAALLDELMGRGRNEGSLNSTKKEISWEDPEYCRYHLVKFCPHDLFVNTKADLGPCPKVHCDEAKAIFSEVDDTFTKLQYEEDFMRFAMSMLHDVERKIQRGEQRLTLMNKTDSLPQLTSAQTNKNDEQIKMLTEKINDLVAQAEEKGIAGEVEEAQGLMKLCDSLKKEREELSRKNENSHWSQTAEIAKAQEKQMEVCKTCGAFLIVGDAQSRIDDHLTGKLHSGYSRLKSAVDEISKRHAELKLKRQKARDEERNRRVTDRDRKTRRKTRSRSKDRDRRRDRDREKAKSRDHNRHNGHRRSKSPRDHKRRDRSRDRDRDAKRRTEDRNRSSRPRHDDNRSRSHSSKSGRRRD